MKKSSLLKIPKTAEVKNLVNLAAKNRLGSVRAYITKEKNTRYPLILVMQDDIAGWYKIEV